MFGRGAWVKERYVEVVMVPMGLMGACSGEYQRLCHGAKHVHQLEQGQVSEAVSRREARASA